MKRRVAWPGAMALALAIAGCSKDETPPPDAMGDGTVKSVATVVSGGNNFRLPLDAALSPDGRTAYFSALVDEGAALFRVPASGGTPMPVTPLESPRGETAHLRPQFLPDGRHYIFMASAVKDRRVATYTAISRRAK